MLLPIKGECTPAPSHQWESVGARLVTSEVVLQEYVGMTNVLPFTGDCNWLAFFLIEQVHSEKAGNCSKEQV